MTNAPLKSLAALANLQQQGLVVKTEPPQSEAQRAAAAQTAANEAEVKAAKQRAQDTVRVMRETKGRAGKGVTLVKGITLGDIEMQALTQQLKTACACGGTVKDGVITIQGDHAERILAQLTALGFRPKRAGG